MSKAHRGTPLKEEKARSGRGTCPVTGKTGVKLLYEVELDGQKTMVSKAGKATLANIKKRQEKEGRKAQAAATPAPAAKEERAATEEPAAKEEATEEAASDEPAEASANESSAEASADESEKPKEAEAPAGA
jgi:hypothetical protein